MIPLKLVTPAQRIIPEYSGNVVRFQPQFALAYVNSVISDTITNKMKDLNGPMYLGELEALVLDPLLQLARDILSGKAESPSATQERMMKLSINYAVIEQTMQVYEIKEVSRTLTQQMIDDSAIGKLLNEVQAGLLDTAKEDSPSSMHLPVVELLEKWISGDDSNLPFGKATVSTSPEMQSALDILRAEFFPMKNFVTSDGSIASTYNLFLQEARTGKGTAQPPQGRHSVAQRISIIRSAVDELIRKALDSTDALRITQWMTAAITLANALMNYLKMAKDPDVYFPRQDVQFNAQSWASALKSEAGELRDLWLSFALATPDLMITLARRLWDNELEWMSYLGETFTVLEESKRLLDDVTTRYSTLHTPLMQKWADAILEGIKTFTGASLVLPNSFLSSDVIEELENSITTDMMARQPQFQSKDAECQRDIPTAPQVLSFQDKQLKSIALAKEAQAISSAMEVGLRSFQMLSLQQDDVQPLAPLSSTDPEDWIYPTIHSGREEVKMTFSKPAMLSAALPVFDGEELSDQTNPDVFKPRWVMKDWMFKPFYPATLRAQRLAKTGAWMMWDAKDVPDFMGDAVSQPWGRQNIPACYTYTRNRSFAPYTMKEFLNSKHGAIDGISKSEYLRFTAQLIAGEGVDSPQAKAIVNYLSAVMRVEVNRNPEAKQKTWSLIEPTIYSIYGVPSLKFCEKQAAAWKDAKKPLESTCARVYPVTLKTGETLEFRFTLHLLYPEPAKIQHLVQCLDTGIILPMPIAQFALDASLATRVAELDPDYDDIGKSITWDNSLIKWMQPLGWSPFQNWMPHVFFDTFVRVERPFTAIIASATLARISMRQEPITKGLVLRGFVDDPLAIMDDSDLDAVSSSSDPVIEETKAGAAPDVTKDVQPKGEDNGGPAPAGIAAVDAKEKGEQAADTSANPVLEAHRTSGNKVAIEIHQKVEPGLAGDANEISQKTESELAGDADQEKSKPEMPTESGEDVWVVVSAEGEPLQLKRVRKGEIPEGARLASDAEVKEWLQTHGS